MMFVCLLATLTGIYPLPTYAVSTINSHLMQRVLTRENATVASPVECRADIHLDKS